MNILKTIGYILFSGLFLAAGSVVSAQGTPLNGTSWKLIEARGKAVTNSSASISFAQDSKKFSGSTGCNRMFGEAELGRRKIDLRAIGTTKMMCKLMEGNVAEPVYLQALEDAAYFRITGGRLQLLDRHRKTILRFRREIDPTNASLLERKWVLESIKGRQTFAPLPDAFIRFRAEKNGVGGDTSCNVFGGNYKVNGDKIEFSDMISTMRACTEDNRMSVEREMLDGLRAANRFEIKDDRLFLYKKDELLLTFRGEEG